MSILDSNKKIAKNSLLLYIRMLLNMVITFYTSRVVLNTLGVEDFGIYGVIGGIVSLLSFLNGCMSSTTSRFYTFELGRNDERQLKKVFSAALTIHIIIAVIILILGEFIGVWWIKNKLIVPLERINAVYWVFHLSIVTTVLNIVQVPYNAAIIAHEKMDIYAFVEILNSMLKLAVAFLITICHFDKLILYSVFLSCVALFVVCIYRVYCLNHFPETHYSFHNDKKIIKPLLSFSGWELFGACANVAKSQGNNILLNIFFGVTLNAAYSLSNQVYGAVGQFVNSFQIAVNPQIIKNYARGNMEQFFNLIYKSARFSYFIVLIPIIPIIYNIDYILVLWLKNPPVYVSIFVVLILLDTMVNTLATPLVFAAKSIGKIKYYQIIVGLLLFLNLPLSYILFLKFDMPYIMFYVRIVLSIATLIYRIYFLKWIVKMSLRNFWKNVCNKVISSTIFLFVVFSFVKYYWGVSVTLLDFVIQTIIIIVIEFVVIYFVGLYTSERLFINKVVTCFFKHKKL